jgi:hypothetical protein
MRYCIKHKNIPVAEVNIDEVTHTINAVVKVFEKDRLPVKIEGKSETADILSVNKWLLNRGIPYSREGVDVALRKLSVADTNALLLLSYGLNLTDQYWLCPKDREVDWNEVNFFEHDFSKDVGNIFFEVTRQKEELDLFSPDSSLTGMLKKRWEIINKKKILLKGGTFDIQQEPFNEVIASVIMEKLHIDHVDYRLAREKTGKFYSLCECMVDKNTELINADYVLHYFPKPDQVALYDHYINTCEQMGIKNVRETIEKMIGVDYIIVNTDRHHNNFGIIRDADTLRWIKLAPIHDSGTSLWNTRINIHPEEDSHSSSFTDAAETNEVLIGLVRNFGWFDAGKLRGIGGLYHRILKNNPAIDEKRRNALCGGLEYRIKMLAKLAR